MRVKIKGNKKTGLISNFLMMRMISTLKPTSLNIDVKVAAQLPRRI
jgi:hypothetical protein